MSTRPVLISEKIMVAKKFQRAPETYFSPGTICALGYWVPEKKFYIWTIIIDEMSMTIIKDCYCYRCKVKPFGFT